MLTLDLETKVLPDPTDIPADATEFAPPAHIPLDGLDEGRALTALKALGELLKASRFGPPWVVVADADVPAYVDVWLSGYARLVSVPSRLAGGRMLIAQHVWRDWSNG